MNSYFKKYQNHKIPHTLGSFDDKGIPLFNPESLKLKGKQSYHPIVIVQYALAHYNLWIENNNKNHKDTFLKCANWLVNNYTYHKEYDLAIYYYYFDLKNPPVKAPWYSGMAQGQILSLFVRAYYETGDNSYIIVSDKIVNSFKTNLDKNGCNSYLSGHIFIQEIAQNPKLYILNGALYAIIGLIEYSEISNKNNLEIDKFIKGIEGLLPKFDLGFWTKYSLGMRFNLSDVYYQQVHAEQLTYLGEKLDNYILLSYGNKFKNQLEKNSKWMKWIHFLSLTINRGFRFLGFGKFLYKFSN
ncbi:MAG TPA: hypothetical protein DDZ39_10690 [Flavobacteriaceae bacterium]|jgi:hypothetical protein|nr:hypothetical protein [Flavobacteriaceae bacterium]HBS11912.1 hypothetical protein [Flavobacteriaceae bacterium]